jgi:hypothetical protein
MNIEKKIQGFKLLKKEEQIEKLLKMLEILND